jgi:hypothetical protein
MCPFPWPPSRSITVRLALEPFFSLALHSVRGQSSGMRQVSIGYRNLEVVLAERNAVAFVSNMKANPRIATVIACIVKLVPYSPCIGNLHGTPVASGSKPSMRPYAEKLRVDFAVTVDPVGQSGRPLSPDLAARITRAYKLRQQPVGPPQRELSGVSFCDGQDDFPELSRFFWSVCRVSHTAR